MLPTSTKRRTVFFGACAIAALGWARLVFAQQKKPPVLIGWLHPGYRQADGHYVGAFKEGMTALGWKDGVDFTVDERWMEGRTERMEPSAAELAKKGPAAFVAYGGGAARAAAGASPATPIVQVASPSPVEAGLAKSLARPGGMVTGLTNLAFDLAEKRLELLLDAVPGLKRVGFLVEMSPTTYDLAMNAARRSIARYPVEARFGEVARPEDIETALARLAKDGIQALIVMPGNFVPSERNRVIPVAQKQRWPVVTGHPEWTEGGALLSYGADLSALYRRAAYFVDRIFKGAKPGDLPIEQPMTFQLVINLKTAQALGLALPRELLVRADRIIE